MGEFINPADVPKVKFYTGDEAPCIGMGTFGSDRFTADQIAEAVARSNQKWIPHVRLCRMLRK